MTRDWQRLADYVHRRRSELGLSQAAMAIPGVLSIDRIQKIEGAKRDSYRLGTLLALEKALRWADGSVDAILDGGEPGVIVTGAASATLGGLQATARGETRAHAQTAHARSEAQPIGVRETPPAADTGEAYEGDETEPDLERAFELLAEAQNLIAKVKRERQKGA